MKLHQTIKDDITKALRAKDAVRLDTLRGLNASFINEMVANPSAVEKDPSGIEFLSDEKALALVKRSVKQRKDSIEQFEKGGRVDLAEKERVELAILETYMPKMMSREEIRVFVMSKLGSETNLDPKSAGKLTGSIMKELSGRADGADVKAVVDELVSPKK